MTEPRPWGSTRRVRHANYMLWMATWNTHGQCTTCHQHAGMPCLDLRPESDHVYQNRPHRGRCCSTEADNERSEATSSAS